jgi:hypothetical protein
MTDSTDPVPLKDYAEQLVDESAADLRASLEALGDSAEPVYKSARDLAVLTVQVYAAKLKGENTDVAEVALVGIAENLKSAGSILAATETLAFAARLLERTKKILITALMAAI